MQPDAIDWAAVAFVHAYQIGLLATLVGIVAGLFGRRWPHLAYALWLVVLAKCFVPPIWSFSFDPLRYLTPQMAVSAQADVDAERPARVSSFDADGAASAASPLADRDDTPAPIKAAARPLNDADAAPSDFAPLFATHQRTLGLVWISGSILLVGIAIGRGSVSSRMLRRTSRAQSAQLAELTDRVAQTLRLRHDVRVRVTRLNAGPMVVGLWSPTVYLPEALLVKMRPPQIEAVLAHELLHIRRRDTWVAIVQFAAQAIWWFHPLVWWMNRQLVRQRERCCDEEAVTNLNGNRSEYARCLVEVLEAKYRLEPMWGYPAVRPVELTRRRLEEIMNRSSMTHARTPSWCWLVAATIALAALPSGLDSARAETNRGTEPTEARIAQAGSKTRQSALLKHGDGKADGKKSYGGSGQMIRFELPRDVKTLHGIRIHGSRYGYPQAPQEDFEITFLDENFAEILHSEAAPYHLFKRGKEQWVRVLFDEPIELPKTFWIALNFNAHQTKGVYLSYDTSTKGEFSRVGLAGDDEPPKETDFGGDWMVQAMLNRSGR